MKKQKTTALIAIILAAILTLSGCNPREEAQGPVVITYATLNIDFEMEEQIAVWNQSQEECRIEIQNYEDSDVGRMQLNNDIVSGKGPDLLDLSDINVGNYAAKGILADLYPFIDADEQLSRQELVPGVIQTYEVNGKLYGIPLGYRFETLLGKKELVGDAVNWTTDKMLQRLQELKEDDVLLDALSPMGLLRAALAADMSSYVNWEKGECYFEDEKFRKLLELASCLEPPNMTMEETKERLSTGSLLLERAYISSVSEFQSYSEEFGGDELSWLGFPSEQGGKAILYTRMPIGILEMSENKDIAWKFISFLCGEEFQANHILFNFPIRLSALQESFQTAMGENPYIEQPPDAPEWIPATQREIDTLFAGICNSQSEAIFDANIWNIVYEETAPFFEGSKTMDEVINVIQSRVSLYVSENSIKAYTVLQ